MSRGLAGQGVGGTLLSCGRLPRLMGNLLPSSLWLCLNALPSISLWNLRSMCVLHASELARTPGDAMNGWCPQWTIFSSPAQLCRLILRVSLWNQYIWYLVFHFFCCLPFFPASFFSKKPPALSWCAQSSIALVLSFASSDSSGLIYSTDPPVYLSDNPGYPQSSATTLYFS